MSGTLEREIKLRFDSVVDARNAVTGAGATPLRPRRMQADTIMDTDDARLRDSRCALRVRVEPGHCFLTYKGPPQPSAMKLREELETSIGDGTLVMVLLERLGFRAWFRSEKYREEFTLAGVVIAVDETPVGTFIEIEGSEAGIASAAAALGRKPADYVTDSYRALFLQQCERRGVPPADMLFPR
jgi:adenylate cyclase class 2